MKKLVFLVLLGLITAGLCAEALAEQGLALTATASSMYSGNSAYGPDKALDGNTGTYWLGRRYDSPWWIVFDAGNVVDVGDINMKWYSSYYSPLDYDIQVSNDGATWQAISIGLEGKYGKDGETQTIGRQARYIKLYINSANYFPVLREFNAYQTIAIPRTVRFQGILKDSSGIPLNGDYWLTFRVYDTKTGEAVLWEENQFDVAIVDGVLDVELGVIVPLDLPFTSQYWIGVEIEGDGEMTPRFKLTSVPYALVAKN